MSEIINACYIICTLGIVLSGILGVIAYKAGKAANENKESEEQ